MTYLHVLANADAVETWNCDRFFNPRPAISVYIVRRRRYYVVHGKPVRTSVERLRSESWKKAHRLELPR